MKIEWTQAMSTGIPELDGQHRALFQQLNTLDDLLDCPSCEIKISDVMDLFDYLEDFARHHFADEERQMEVFHCEAQEENIEAHHLFLAKLNEYRHRFRDDGASQELVTDIRDKLLIWVKEHVMGIDVQLYKAVYNCPSCTVGEN